MHLDPDRGGDMQILTFFKFPLVADSFGSAFPAREQKEVDRVSDCINSGLISIHYENALYICIFAYRKLQSASSCEYFIRTDTE